MRDLTLLALVGRLFLLIAPTLSAPFPPVPSPARRHNDEWKCPPYNLEVGLVANDYTIEVLAANDTSVVLERFEHQVVERMTHLWLGVPVDSWVVFRVSDSTGRSVTSEERMVKWGGADHCEKVPEAQSWWERQNSAFQAYFILLMGCLSIVFLCIGLRACRDVRAARARKRAQVAAAPVPIPVPAPYVGPPVIIEGVAVFPPQARREVDLGGDVEMGQLGERLPIYDDVPLYEDAIRKGVTGH
ncbi:hypothetical protein JCM10207_001221 [Rhodosporidiobolus poonsookiae]